LFKKIFFFSSKKFFQPIIPNSSFRFIWLLPESPAGRNFPVPHFFKFIYTVCSGQKENKNSEFNKELIESEEYCIEKRLDFTIPKVTKLKI